MKYVNKLIAVFFSAILLLSIYGCGQQPTKTPTEVVSEQIDLIKDGNRDLYRNMFWHGIINVDTKNNVKDIFKTSSVKIDEALSSMDYTVNSEKISGDNAVVNVTLTGPELDSVWSDLVQNVRNDISSGALSITKLDLDTIADRYDKIISNLLDNMKTSTRSMDIKLVKEQGEWKIDNTDNIVKLTINMHPDKVKHVLNHI